MTTPESHRPPLRLGILGCANIARAFARDVADSPAVRVDAVASRSADKAAEFARAFGIGRQYDHYQALLDDPALNAVYIPLPNSLHAEWAIRAAAAGKHVLSEKPLALGLAEARSMFDAARQAGVMLLEAYPWWFQPQTGALMDLLRGGAIGQLRSVQASFGFSLSNPQGNIRMQPDLGGGALLDAGCYPLSLILLAMGRAPDQVQAHAQWAPTGVDIHMAASLWWDDGRFAQLSCAMNTALHRHATLIGSDGVIETEFLNHTAPGGIVHPLGFLPSLMRLRRAGAGRAAPYEVIESPTGSGFRFAAEAFARVVAAQDHAAIDAAAAVSLDIASTLEALANSARSGQAVALGERVRR